MHLLSKLENDHKLYNPYAERKAQSENGKDKLQIKDILQEENSDDYKVYKYFSNSAQYPVSENQIIRPHRHSSNALQNDSELDHINHNASQQYCQRCQGHLKETPLCSFCERKRLNLPMNENFCLKCSMPLKTALNRENGVCDRCRRTDMLCGFCQKKVEVCPKCNAVFCLRCHQRQDKQPPRPPLPSYEDLEILPKSTKTILAITQRHEDRPIISNVLKVTSNNSDKARNITNTLPYQSFDLYDSDSEHDFPEAQSLFTVRDDRNPYSTNVDRNSIFHPNKKVEEPKVALNIRNGQIFVEDLDEKLAKYARNYGELKSRTSTTPTPRRQIDNSFPLMPTVVQASKKSPAYRQPEHRKKESPAVKMLQQKWDVSSW